MNKKTLLILCLVLALVLVGAGALYNSLAGSAQLGGLATTPPETQAPTEIPGEQSTEPAETHPTEPPANIAPDFTMLDMDGNEVTLASFFGKPIVLNFWASWCGPCKMEMPEIQKFYDKYGQEIHFLLVSVDDSLAAAKTFISDSGYTFPVFFDTDLDAAIKYSVYALPTTYFIDAEGYAVAQASGAIDAKLLQRGIDMICKP